MNISKTTIAIALLSLLLTLLGVFSYYNTKLLNQNIKALNEQNTELLGKVNKQDEVINNIKNSVSNNINILNDLDVKRKETDIQVANLVNKVSTHDFEKIAEKKPKLLEKVLKNSVKEQNKRLMEISK